MRRSGRVGAFWQSFPDFGSAKRRSSELAQAAFSINEQAFATVRCGWLCGCCRLERPPRFVLRNCWAPSLYMICVLPVIACPIGSSRTYGLVLSQRQPARVLVSYPRLTKHPRGRGTTKTAPELATSRGHTDVVRISRFQPDGAHVFIPRLTTTPRRCGTPRLRRARHALGTTRVVCTARRSVQPGRCFASSPRLTTAPSLWGRQTVAPHGPRAQAIRVRRKHASFQPDGCSRQSSRLTTGRPRGCGTPIRRRARYALGTSGWGCAMPAFSQPGTVLRRS